MVLLLAIGCSELPFLGPETATPVTMCDGCHTESTFDSGDIVVPAGAVFLLTLAAGTQEPSELATWVGNAGDGFGAELASLDDLDGDGLRDLWANGGTSTVLRSGDGSGRRHAELEGALDPVPDLDGDGRGEAALSAGRKGAILPWTTLAVGGELTVDDGWPVDVAARAAPGPDLDADGVEDVVWVDADVAAERTRVFVVSGATAAGGTTGEVTLLDVSVQGVVGPRDVTRIGDVDGDGFEDLAVATRTVSPSYEWRCRLRVWSGAALAEGEVEDLAVLEQEGSGEPAFDVAALGDLDGDGREDLAIAWSGFQDAVARVVSGADLTGVHPLGEVGRPLAWSDPGGLGLDAADLDGDGLTELLVMEAGTGRGRLLQGTSVADGSDEVSHSFKLGVSAALAGVDGDGALRVWVGAPYEL